MEIGSRWWSEGSENVKVEIGSKWWSEGSGNVKYSRLRLATLLALFEPPGHSENLCTNSGLVFQLVTVDLFGPSPVLPISRNPVLDSPRECGTDSASRLLRFGRTLRQPSTVSESGAILIVLDFEVRVKDL
nr:hypothetical protein Iba_chr12eCG7350 [Ipomoea batatas]